MQQHQCWQRRPGIEQTFTNLVRRLEARPVTTRVASPIGGSPVKVKIDGGRLVNWLIDESFHTPDYRIIPAMIGELANGNPRPIARAVAAQLIGSGTGIVGWGLGTTVGCSEWIPYMKGSILSAGRRAFPAYPDSVLRPALHDTYIASQCSAWKVPKAPAEQREATRSRIPTLLMSGSFDAVTPTSWARIAARSLPNSTDLEFAGIGHFSTLFSPCAQRVFSSFLATPSAPNTACVAQLRPPRFKPAPPPPRERR
jgi:pimeloyl-ACP methyl ester carboxylesterase